MVQSFYLPKMDVKHNLQYQANQNNDLIENILSEKIGLIRSKANDIVKLIDERQTIKAKVLTDLDDEILKARNMILERAPQFNYTPITTDPLSKDLEKEIFRLEKSKIDEEVRAWNDVLRLKREIIDLVNELSNADIRRRLIENESND